MKSPSFLEFQRTMQKTQGKNNAQTLSGVFKIPTDNHIRSLLDAVEPVAAYPLFDFVALGQKALYEYVDAFNESRDFELPVFIYYGTWRAVFDVPRRKKGFGKDFTRFDALQEALESRTNFRRFVEYFYYLEDIEHKKAKRAALL